MPRMQAAAKHGSPRDSDDARHGANRHRPVPARKVPYSGGHSLHQPAPVLARQAGNAVFQARTDRDAGQRGRQRVDAVFLARVVCEFFERVHFVAFIGKHVSYKYNLNF